MLETVLKIWMPLVVLIVIGYFFKFSLFVLLIAFLTFFIVEYYFNVLTKERWNDLVQPLKVVYSRL
jgi:ABC-type transport system involved in cytochrome bd biosynthesis fused ATPase/permease subunit